MRDDLRARRWQRDDELDARLRGPHWGSRPVWKRLRDWQPEFTREVTTLYRAGCFKEAIEAERRGHVFKLQEEAWPLGGIVAELMSQRRKPYRRAA